MHTKLPLVWRLPVLLPALLALNLPRPAGAEIQPIDQVTAPTGLPAQAPSAGVLATTVAGAYPDLWSLQSGTIYRSHEVGLFDSYQEIGSSAVALATLKGGGPVAGTDAVVSVGVNGVRLYTIVAATQLPTMTVVDGGYFTGVMVRCGDVTGDGQADIVVLDQSNNLFRVYSKSGTWSLAGVIPLSGVTVSGFDLGQMDVLGSRLELLTAEHNGMRGYSLSGPTGGVFSTTAIMWRINDAYTNNHVVTLKDHVSKGIDGVGWVTRVGSSTTSYLTSASFVIPGSQPVVALAAGLTVQGVASGPLNFISESGNLANRADVVVNYVNSNLVEYFVNRGPALGEGFIRNSTWSGEISISSPNTTSFGSPVVGDLEGNGFGDITTGAVAGVAQSLWMGFDPVKDGPGGGGPPQAFALYIEPQAGEEYVQYWMIDDLQSPATISPAVESADTSRVVSLGLWRQVDGIGRFIAVGTSRCDAPTTVVHSASLSVIGGTLAQTDPNSTPETFELNGDVYALRIQPLTALPDGTRPVFWVALSNFRGSAPTFSIPDWHNNQGLEVRPAASNFNVVLADPVDGIGEVIPAIEVRRIKPPQGTTPTPNPNPTVGCVP